MRDQRREAPGHGWRMRVITKVHPSLKNFGGKAQERGKQKIRGETGMIYRNERGRGGEGISPRDPVSRILLFYFKGLADE